MATMANLERMIFRAQLETIQSFNHFKMAVTLHILTKYHVLDCFCPSRDSLDQLWPLHLDFHYYALDYFHCLSCLSKYLCQSRFLPALAEWGLHPQNRPKSCLQRP